MVGLCHCGGKVGEVAELMADRQDRTRTSIEVGVDVNGACEQVEFDFIAIFYHGNRSAHSGFGAAMHAYGTAGDAGDAGV